MKAVALGYLNNLDIRTIQINQLSKFQREYRAEKIMA